MHDRYREVERTFGEKNKNIVPDFCLDPKTIDFFFFLFALIFFCFVQSVHIVVHRSHVVCSVTKALSFFFKVLLLATS